MSFSPSSHIVLAVVLSVAATAAVATATFWYAMRRRARQRPAARQLPRQWPVNPRSLTNSAERQVWAWMRETFADQHIMVKLPITRFTHPREGEEARQLFDILTGVYCTFAVCTGEGRVLGCVDVPGAQGLPRANRRLKQGLLSQCGIAYWVVMNGSLPKAEVIRAEFLGELHADPMSQRQSEVDRMERARAELHELLDRNRGHRFSQSGFNGLDGAPGSGFGDGSADPDSGFTGWRQPDSFLAPIDSRQSDAPQRRE